MVRWTALLAVRTWFESSTEKKVNKDRTSIDVQAFVVDDKPARYSKKACATPINDL